MPGSHHPQFIDVLHRQQAVDEDQVRTNKAMGLRNLPSKTWQVNKGWVLAANIAADLDAWCQHLAATTATVSRTPSRTPWATGRGSCLPASSATPASASSKSAAPGRGKTPS
jgi:uncharacterized glyoxalase superfamily protein PhnB